MHKIRVIIDNNNTKVYNQYNQICNLLPIHSLYIYKRSNNIKEEHFDYNLYFDVISERVYNDLCPAKYTILLVNEEYVNTQKYFPRHSQNIPQKGGPGVLTPAFSPKGGSGGFNPRIIKIKVFKFFSLAII